MEENINCVDSIIKAKDDNTVINQYNEESYLYSIILSHVEHIKANLYNFKFIARILNNENTKEVYLNLQVLINDSSIVDNSKYSIEDNARLSLVNSYFYNGSTPNSKENEDNSYRIDFSINYKPDCKFKNTIQIVNNMYNIVSEVFINKETFFKIAIFLYQLLSCNMIDGDIFYKKFSTMNALYNDDRYTAIKTYKDTNKIYTIYWDNTYISSILQEVEIHKYQLIYMVFTKEEYEDKVLSIYDEEN